MKLLERYIFRRVLALTLVTLGGATVVALVTQLLRRLNLLTQSSEAIRSLLELAATLAPAVGMIVLPLALLIGALRVLSTMNTDSELAVVEASGASRWVVGKPIVLLGLALSLCALLSAHFIEPSSNRAARRIVTEASADLVRFAVNSGSFERLRSNLYIQISEELPGGDFGGIVIVDGRDEQTELIYYAERGSIRTIEGSSLLVLVDGELHREERDSGDITIITFVSSALDFSNFTSAGAKALFSESERSTRQLLDPPPNDWLYKSNPELLRREVHKRFSEWLYPLAFGLIAVYFAGAAQSHRDERLWQLTFACLVALGFRALGFVTLSRAGGSAIDAALVYAVPLSAIVVFALLILRGHSARASRVWLDRLAMGIDAARNALERIQLRLSGYRRREAGGGG